MADNYRCAARVLESIDRKKGTIKSLVFNSSFKNKKAVFALVYGTLKYRAAISDILRAVPELQKNVNQKSLLYIYIFDCMFGKGLQGSGSVVKLIRAHKKSLDSALQKLKVKKMVATNEELLPPNHQELSSLPRYARVNSLLSSLENVEHQLCQDGFISSKDPDSHSRSFYHDEHIPDLLVFSPGTDLHDHHLVTSSKLILQDKASCFSAVALDPQPGSHVIDCCAAPGNKTCHLSALMGNSGTIFAFDADKSRFALMKKLLESRGVTNVLPHHRDFLDVDPLDQRYAKVGRILVDPSCSGSGIIGRKQHDTQAEARKGPHRDRLQRLASFQVQILSHALKFPKVHRVVYSTCSIHQAENEDVVMAILAGHPEFALSPALPTWPRRGLPVFPEAGKCVRVMPEDRTNGFFVAVFDRRPHGPSHDLEDAQLEDDRSNETQPNTGKKLRSRPRSLTNGDKARVPGSGRVPERSVAPSLEPSLDASGLSDPKGKKRKRRMGVGGGSGEASGERAGVPITRDHAAAVMSIKQKRCRSARNVEAGMMTDETKPSTSESESEAKGHRNECAGGGAGKAWGTSEPESETRNGRKGGASGSGSRNPRNGGAAGSESESESTDLRKEGSPPFKGAPVEDTTPALVPSRGERRAGNGSAPSSLRKKRRRRKVPKPLVLQGM